MTSPIPCTTNRPLQFEHGEAIGMSQRWHQGQYCSILTSAGIVGCGIYDLKTAGEFGQAIAIAKPWGQSVPPPASAPAELARPSTGSAPPPSAWPTVDVETSQPVMIIFLPVEDPSASPGSCTSYQLTPTSANGQYDITADPSGVPYIGGGFAMDANGNTVVEVTCGAGWQPLEPSSPQPTGS